MPVLVTGVSGFSGSVIAATLANAGIAVTGLYRRGYGFAGGYAGLPGLTLVQADLAALKDLPGAFETVVHVAATSSAPAVSEADIRRDNAEATERLVTAATAAGCQRFIYLSSMSIYGEISVPVVDESTPIIRPDVYGATKLQGEDALAAQAGRMAGIALRLPGVIGKGAHRNWLSGVASRLLAGQEIPAFNLAAKFNNACHVADLARFVTGLCRRDWQGFDVVVLGACGMTTVRGAIEGLAAALGVAANIREVPSPKPAFTLSSRRAIERWNYDPMDIDAMIAQFGREIRT